MEKDKQKSKSHSTNCGHHHFHHNHNNSNHEQLKRISFAFWLNLSFSVLEIVSGFWINSVAILSDALHDFGDSLTLGCAYYLEKLSVRRRDHAFSYGYRRFSLLAALINGMVILTGSTLILIEAVPRIWEPETTQPLAMIGLAFIGIMVNGAGLLRLKKGNTPGEKMFSWHLLEDLLGWLAVLIGAIVMHFFELPIIDPLLAIAFTIFTVYNVVKILRNSLKIFLQAIPDEINLDELETKLTALPGIVSVHDTHIWSLDGVNHVLTTHLVMNKKTSLPESLKLKQRARRLIGEYQIDHATIEMENEDEQCHLKNC